MTCPDKVTTPAQTLSASLCSLQHQALLATFLQEKEQQRCWWLCWERRGQGLNSGLGELKYSKHKADVALPRLHVNQRHMLPPLWQHMCTVYLEDPHCHLFLFPPSQDWKEFAPALHGKLMRGVSSPRIEGMRATFNFLTKRTQCCPFEMISRSPTSPGDFSPSEHSQEQLNIRKPFQGLFHISHNPIIMHSLVMSSHTPSLARAMPLVTLGRLGVTSPGTAWTVAAREGTWQGLCLWLFAQAQVCPSAGSSILGVKSSATLSVGKGRGHCGDL